jgi:hypothetical protein
MNDPGPRIQVAVLRVLATERVEVREAGAPSGGSERRADDCVEEVAACRVEGVSALASSTARSTLAGIPSTW